MVRTCALVRLTLPEIIHFTEDLLVLNVAAAVLTQGRSAHGALQAAHVPYEVVHLEQVSVEDLEAAAGAHILPRRRYRAGRGRGRAHRRRGWWAWG